MRAILACTPDGGIGYKNALPWPFLNGDLRRFQTLTSGGVIVMGRHTWESLPKKPLPNRLNIVVSSGSLDLPPGSLCVNSIEHFSHFRNAWLIGGNKLLQSAWHLVNEIHLSMTNAHYDCDTFIGLVKLKDEFTLVSSDPSSKDHVYQIWKKNHGTISESFKGHIG